MEPYLFLYHITNELDKLRYDVLHINQEHWQWWKWRKNVLQVYVDWTHFFLEIYELFEPDTHHLCHLTKLKQYCGVEDFIVSFECLAFFREGMSDVFFLECFISGLKDEICAHILMAHPWSWVEATKIDKKEKQVVSSQTKKPSFIPLPKPVTLTPSSTPLKIQELT
jgi:hypothetical protein